MNSKNVVFENVAVAGGKGVNSANGALSGIILSSKKQINVDSSGNAILTPAELELAEKAIADLKYRESAFGRLKAYFGGYLDEDTDDVYTLTSLKDNTFEFMNPFSLEFRGINDLYNMIMLKLLFVFFFLLILCLYVSILIGLAYASQWDKVKKTFKNEWVVMSAGDVFIEIQKDGQAAGSISKFIMFSPSRYVEAGIDKIDATVGVSSKIRGFYSKLDKMFSANSFWVYYSNLEFLWTLLPCIILLLISVPSFTLALALDETHKPAAWIKVIGNQWFWVYEYSTYSDNIVIYSNIAYGPDLSSNALRVVETDSIVTLVNNKFTRLLVTSADVIHCWAVPSLGIKIDACPGRINSISVLPTRPGVYYGQCSEICGVNHAFMPICVEVVV